MGKFKTNYPEHYFDVGIAEQNMVTVAAGMALEGNCVFVSTYASFLAVRGLEQIRHNLGYLQTNVKLVGLDVLQEKAVSHIGVQKIWHL